MNDNNIFFGHTVFKKCLLRSLEKFSRNVRVELRDDNSDL